MAIDVFFHKKLRIVLYDEPTTFIASTNMIFDFDTTIGTRRADADASIYFRQIVPIIIISNNIRPFFFVSVISTPWIDP